jgi:Inner membrane component of T3SS, cytoplasmic domain
MLPRFQANSKWGEKMPVTASTPLLSSFLRRFSGFTVDAALAKSGLFSRVPATNVGDLDKSRKSFEFLIQSGLHAGVKKDIRLDSGRSWIVGSSPDADLVLLDPEIAARHLAFQFLDNQLVITSLANGVTCNEEQFKVGQSRLYKFEEISNVEAGVLLKLVDVSICFKMLSTETNYGAPGKSIISTKIIGFAVLCFLAVLFFSYLATSKTSSRLNNNALSSSSEKAVSEIVKMISANPDWTGLNLDQAKDGKIIVRGAVAEKSKLDTFLRHPRVMLAGVDVRVVVGEDLRRQILEFLADPGLLVSVEGSTATITGKAQRLTTKASLNQLQRELGSRVTIADNSTREIDEKQKRTVRVELPVRMSFVNVGEQYFETVSGARYTIGSNLANGYVVEAIEARKIVFRVSGKPVNFPLE